MNELSKYHYRLIEDYKGFEVMFYINFRKQTEYFYIAKDGERISQLCLTSPKACRNVIDTHVRNILKPEYAPIKRIA